MVVVLALLFVGLQGRLWFGDASVPAVYELRGALAEQEARNAAAEARNDALRAEVEDLREGRDAIEERARSELGMIRSDEVFYQVVEE